jgi:predicted nucleic acid-binding protein
VTLRALLDSDDVSVALPVRVEFVAAASKKQRPKLRRLIAALPLVVPSEETWRLVETWKARGIDAGYSFSLSDLLIAALAHELTGLVWSLDTDFDAMEKLGFVRCY